MCRLVSPTFCLAHTPGGNASRGIPDLLPRARAWRKCVAWYPWPSASRALSPHYYTIAISRWWCRAHTDHIIRTRPLASVRTGVHQAPPLGENARPFSVLCDRSSCYPSDFWRPNLCTTDNYHLLILWLEHTSILNVVKFVKIKFIY